MELAASTGHDGGPGSSAHFLNDLYPCYDRVNFSWRGLWAVAESHAALPLYLDPDARCEERVADLLSRMTLEEKVAQLQHDAPAVPRLEIPAYNWWNECLHGVARAGLATVFPQAIGMAATFSPDLLFQVANVISDEARAKHHEALRRGETGIYKGLTFWSPNINIFRDPRWGRGQETYGEDPYLSGRLGVAFVRGLQGDHPRYLKVVATPKHFAAHSGPESSRHSFDAQVSRKDLRETYLPAFRECVVEGQAASVMGAYNRLNGDPCCGSRTLLQDILRDEWGFKGYVVSDCGAIADFHDHHKVTESKAESAALALNGGCDLNCGETYGWLLDAVAQGLVGERTIDESLSRLLHARFQLGMFDPPSRVPYAAIFFEQNASEEHRDLAAEVARQSCVLLKNAGSLLPLAKGLASIAVIGPNADDPEVLLANYNGVPPRAVTVREGIRAVSRAANVHYAKGCELIGHNGSNEVTDEDRAGFTEAVAVAQRGDVVVLCLGLSARIEGEEGDAFNSDAAGDRVQITLPGVQQELLETICGLGKPVVLVLQNGGPLDLRYADEHADAIVEAWYPGGEGGQAVADILFGDANPGGRLPVTFVRSLTDLPPFADYSMRNRTYRYLQTEPLYPFGYGLSYTRFVYADLELDSMAVPAGDSVRVRVTVANVGDRFGREVVQLYLQDLDASVEIPRWQLQGVQRVELEAGEAREVTFIVTPRQMALIELSGECVLEPGSFRIHVGGSQPDGRSAALMGREGVSADFIVTGDRLPLTY